MSATGKAVTPSTATSATRTVRLGTSPPGGGRAGTAEPGALAGGAGGNTRGIGEPCGTRFRLGAGACAIAGTVTHATPSSTITAANRRGNAAALRPPNAHRRPDSRASPHGCTIPPLLYAIRDR